MFKNDGKERTLFILISDEVLSTRRRFNVVTTLLASEQRWLLYIWLTCYNFDFTAHHQNLINREEANARMLTCHSQKTQKLRLNQNPKKLAITGNYFK